MLGTSVWMCETETETVNSCLILRLLHDNDENNNYYDHDDGNGDVL